MCGLFGIRLGDGARPEEALLQRSVAALGHRGPDAGITHAEPGLGLAHARLSLVDTHARAHQPFRDPTGRYVLVYNGEVYNFRALRAGLEAAGHVFRTGSDTEVVLAMLIEYGAGAALPRLDGMFALAFIDRAEDRIVLARDRFGMKPLFYRAEPGRFLFASEIKALAPWVTLAPDRGMAAAYLMGFGGPTRGVTFYDGIAALGPGEMLVLDKGRAETRPFFRLTDFLDPDEHARLSALGAGQVADEFEALMAAAVDSHAFADARVGAFCSGGVDSSLIVALAARSNPGLALFHANVKGAWSEAPAARALAKHLGLELHAVEVEERDFLTSIPKVMRHYEYPFSYHPNCAPLMMIAQLARDSGVKGLLSGEGSDELFLGYPWLGRKRLMDGYEALTQRAGALIRAIPGIGRLLLPDRLGNYPAVRSILNGREILDDLNMVSDALRRQPAMARDPRMRWTLDYLHYHLRTLLHRNDTMGMAASIEARFPFLDNAVARFGVNLPARHKLKRSLTVWEKAHPFIRDKWVVRAVADRLIPKELSRRLKIGFWTTVFQRLEIADAFLTSPHLGELLRLGTRQLADLAAEAGPDLRLRLMQLDIWHRVCIAGEDDAVTLARLSDMVAIRPEGTRPSRQPRRRIESYPSAPV